MVQLLWLYQNYTRDRFSSKSLGLSKMGAVFSYPLSKNRHWLPNKTFSESPYKFTKEQSQHSQLSTSWESSCCFFDLLKSKVRHKWGWHFLTQSVTLISTLLILTIYCRNFLSWKESKLFFNISVFVFFQSCRLASHLLRGTNREDCLIGPWFSTSRNALGPKNYIPLWE